MVLQDLDADRWEGWFDLTVQDSGAIMVGGSYGMGDLNWSGGSSYGLRIDVQGWFDRIVTTSADEFADLFYPDDTRQAYTAYFEVPLVLLPNCFRNIWRLIQRFWHKKESHGVLKQLEI